MDAANNKFSVILPASDEAPDPLPENFEHTGPVTEWQGFQWKLILKDDNHRHGSSMFLSCEPIEPSQTIMQWNHEVGFGFGFSSGHMTRFKFFKGKTLRFTDIVLDLSEGFERESFQVTVLKSSVIPYTDFSQPNPVMFADTLVKVEDKEFWVCKTTLANFSPFFNAFFFASEPGEEGYVLQDITAKQFQEFLEFMYHRSEVYYSNCVDLLQIAIIIQHFELGSKCEQYLRKNNPFHWKERLLIAINHNSLELTDFLIKKNFGKIFEMQFRPEHRRGLDRKTLEKIFKRKEELREANEHYTEESSGEDSDEY